MSSPIGLDTGPRELTKWYTSWILPVSIQKLASIVLLVSVCLIKASKISWTARISYADGFYYLNLAQHWYVHGDSMCAFYPLFPALIRITTPVFGGDCFIAGLVLANGFSIAAAYFFHRLVAAQYGGKTALLSLALLLAFPGAICFGLIYTESLFFLLTMLLVWGLRHKLYWLACLSAFLLPLTRAVGVFLALPLAWVVLERIWHALRAGSGAASNVTASAPAEREPGGPVGANHEASIPLANRSAARAIRTIGKLAFSQIYFYALLAVLAGYVAYFATMYFSTGDPLEGFKAQQYYANAPSIANIFNVSGIIQAFLNGGHIHAKVDSIIDRGFFVLFLITLPSVWRLDRACFFYSLGMGLVPALSNWFLSYSRFIELSFPMFIVLAIELQKPGKRWLLWFFLGVMAVIQGMFLFRSISFIWAI